MAMKSELKNRVFEILPKTGLFGGISIEDVGFLTDLLTESRVNKGEVIFAEGDPPGDSYLLLEGQVEISVHGKPIDTFEEGSVMGVASPIGIQNQLFTATAVTDVVMAVIPTKILYLLAHEKPELFGMIMMNVARDLARGLKVMREVIDIYVSAEGNTERRQRPQRAGGNVDSRLSLWAC